MRRASILVAAGLTALVLAATTPAAPTATAAPVAATGTGTGDDRQRVRVVTLAGTGETGYSGDGGAALDARLGDFLRLDVDPLGNVYVADISNQRLRVIRTDGTIDTVPGTRGRRSPRTDGPDVGGWIYRPSNRPQSVAVDAAGNLYVAASQDIRRRDVAGRFTNVTSSDADATGGSADGGPALEADIYEPSDVALDGDGNLYIADKNNDRIRKIGTDGIITTIAGGGDLDRDGSDGEAATEASIYAPGSLAVDSRGNVYFIEGDTGTVIRKVGADGTITTVAGHRPEGFSGDGGPVAEARFSGSFAGLTVDEDDNLYIADRGHGHLRMVDPEGTVSTVPAPTPGIEDVAAGTDGTLVTVAGDSYLTFDEGGFTGDGGPAGDAELNTPGGTAVDAAGHLYIADSYNSRIRRVDPDGTITTIAGTGVPHDSGDGGPAREAGLDEPRDIAVDADGNIYVVSSRSDRVRRIDPEGTITTVAEIGPTGDDDGVDGEPVAATEAELSDPEDIAVGSDGSLHIIEGYTITADGSVRYGRVRRVDADGAITTVEADRAGEALLDPTALTIDADGRMYLIDGLVKRRDSDGVVTTVAGGAIGLAGEESDDSTGSPVADGQVAITAALVTSDVAAGPGGEVYIVTDDAVVELTPEGTLTTLVGPDDDIGGPAALAVDPDDGSLYVATDGGRGSPGRIHHVDADGHVTTVAGSDGEDLVTDDVIGDGGPATDALLSDPTDVAVDAEGNVYVSVRQGIRRIDPDGTIVTVAESPVDAADHPSPASRLALDASGNLYFTEPATHRVRVLVRPGEIPGPGSSPWGTVLRGIAVLAVAGAAVAGFRRRQQLADLVRHRLRSPGPV